MSTKKRVSLPPVLQMLFHPLTRWFIQAVVFLALISLIFIGTARDIPFLKDQQFFIVLSGSMETAIPTGSLVLVTKNTGEPQIDEAWTFVTPRSRQVTTHRILNKRVENGEILYSTKGDANDGADPWILKQPAFVGKVKFALPYAGYIVNFAKTPKGFFVVAVLPGLVIIIDEIFKIKKVMQLEYEKKIMKLEGELKKEKTKKEEKEDSDE